MKRCLIATLWLVCALAPVGCTRSVQVLAPPTGNPPPVQGNPVTFDLKFHSRADVGTFKATLDPNPGYPTSGGTDITASFSPPPASGGRSSATVTLADPPCTSTPANCVAEHRLRVEALMNPRRAFDTTGHEHNFRLQRTPPQPPSGVTSLAPASGMIGTEVSVTGTGFTSNHTVSFGNRGVSTTFVNARELRFKVPQRPVGSYSIAVSGVGSLSFSLVAGTPAVSPTLINLTYGSNATLSATLPLAAPPGGVDLTAAASPAGILQAAGQGRLRYSGGASSETLSLATQDIGSGSLDVSGNGYTTVSVPFSVSFGTPQCGVRARAQGGVEFVSPPGSNNVVGSLPSAQVPGRVATTPGGARGVAQYTAGIAFVDLVNCSSLGSFQNGTIPLNNFAFSNDGRFFAADWFHATQNDGLVAYRLVDGSQLFSRNTTSNSLNVSIAGDSAASFAFWVTSTNTPSGAQPQLGIHSLTGSLARCFVGNVPSSNIAVSVASGVATIQFMGINPPQTWRVRTSDCHRLP